MKPKQNIRKKIIKVRLETLEIENRNNREYPWNQEIVLWEDYKIDKSLARLIREKRERKDTASLDIRKMQI